jgi:proton glutamate symport protein
MPQTQTHSKKPTFSISLTTQIMIGLGIGLLLGIFMPEFGVKLKPFSDLFLRMIKMLIAPLLISSLIVGIAGAGDTKKVGSLGLKTILYFEIATTLALIIGLGVANWLKPGAGVDLQANAKNLTDLATITSNTHTVANHTFMDSVLGMVPTSIFDAMATGNVLQMVVFSVFFALAIMAAGEKGKPVLRGLASLSEIMFKFVGYVMNFAPMGVLAAISYAVSSNGLGILWTYGKLAGSLYLALFIFVGIVLLSTCAIIKVPFTRMFSAIKEPFLIAFSTANSESALPKAMSVMERFGVPTHIVAFVMPTGYSFNLDGSTLYLALATLFVAQMANIQLDIWQQLSIMATLMLTSKGVAAVPRASLVILASTLTLYNLPIEGVAVILGIDHFLDMGRTSVNLVGNCVATAVVARWEGVFDDKKMNSFDANDTHDHLPEDSGILGDPHLEGVSSQPPTSSLDLTVCSLPS